jgi:hypothetical protein
MDGGLKPKSKRAPRSKAEIAAATAAKQQEKAAKAAEKARAREVREQIKAQKKQEAARARLEAGLFSFKRMVDMISYIEHHKPKGGSTQRGWLLVAADMNASASDVHQNMYTPKNCYDKHLTWSKKTAPTGNPQLGDEEELSLMARYKSAEQMLVDATEPDEALQEEEEDKDPTNHKCAHCGVHAGHSGGVSNYKYIAAGSDPVRTVEGVQHYREDAFLSIPSHHSSSAAAALKKFLEIKAQRLVRIYCGDCAAAATAKDTAPTPVAADAGRRGVRERALSQ